MILLTNDRRIASGPSYCGRFACNIITPFLAFCLSFAVLSTCHFIEFEGTAKYAYCATQPLVYHPVEKVVHASLGLARICFEPEDAESQMIEFTSGDIWLKIGSVFAILPVASGVLSFLLSRIYNPEMENQPKILWWFSVIYGWNALFMLLALLSFASDLCNGESCQENYKCSLDTDELEYCVEECRPGAGVALVCAASFFWVVSCIGAYRSFLSLEQDHREVLADDAGKDNTELDASAEWPLIF